MRNIQEINYAASLNPQELNASNYQIMGITYSGQMLVNKEANDYRKDIVDLSDEDRKKFYRNGKRTLKITGLYGTSELNLPVFREKGFCPSFHESWNRSSEELELLVYNSYIGGMSTRRIEDMMAELGISCSRSKVSRINKKYSKEIEEIRNRDLSGINYCLVSLDATYLSVLSGDPDSRHYEDKPMIRVLGLNSETGYWEILSLKIYNRENYESYRDVLENLKRRGLQNPVLFLRDLDAGISKAIKKVYPGSYSQGCLFHLIQAVYRNLPRKAGKEIKKQIYELVREENPQIREQELEELIEIYGETYPKALKSLKRNLENCTTWNVFNPEFKTNNVNERNNEEDKKIVKAKRTFKSVESAEATLFVNTLHYLNKTETKKQADLENLQDMNRRFKAMNSLTQQDVFFYLKEADIPVSPPVFSSPLIWFDTIDVPYDYLGQTSHVKLLLCYGMTKAHRRRRFLWACPLFNQTSGELRHVLESIKSSAKKEPEIIILPADDPILLETVENIFSNSLIQVDLKSFMECAAGLLPEPYSKSFISSFKSAFKNDSQPGVTQEMLDLIEESLSHHHQEEALKVFKCYKRFLLTLFNCGINYFFNFKSTLNLKSCLILKKEDSENNFSFFMRTLKAVRFKTWDIPCVYRDEINALFDRFKVK